MSQQEESRSAGLNQCEDCGGPIEHLFGETFGCTYCGQQFRVTVEAK